MILWSKKCYIDSSLKKSIKCDHVYGFISNKFTSFFCIGFIALLTQRPQVDVESKHVNICFLIERTNTFESLLLSISFRSCCCHKTNYCQCSLCNGLWNVPVDQFQCLACSLFRQKWAVDHIVCSIIVFVITEIYCTVRTSGITKAPDRFAERVLTVLDSLLSFF